MRTKVLSLDALWDGAGVTLEGGESTRDVKRAALRVLRAAMEQELTPRQRQCLELCILQGMSQAEAGRRLGLNKATVCRHLQKAGRSLRRAASYADLGRLNRPG